MSRFNPTTPSRYPKSSIRQTPTSESGAVDGNTVVKRQSVHGGWKRVFAKYSPTTESSMSPIKPTEANLLHRELDESDKYLDLYNWALNMSEQFNYDNSFLLLSKSKNDPKRMANFLRHNYLGVDMHFFNNLENISLLGKGQFGSVFRCQDPQTKDLYAMKYLSAEFKTYVDHAANILEYMTERNSVIRSMDSSFVMKFYYSLQIRGSGSLFLFFEYCIGSLTRFIDSLSTSSMEEISKRLDANEELIIQDLYSSELDTLEVCCVYVFELFCALDFLAKCNIIHQDLKPDNIMLSTTLHLKIGDFGIAYKTRMLDRDSNKLLVKYDDIDKVESSNYETIVCGSLYYQDFEQQLMLIEGEDEQQLDAILDNKRKFNAPKISFDDEVLEPTFLADTWAAGVLAVQLLLRGFHIFDPRTSSKDILSDVPRSNVSNYLVHLVGRQYVFMNYVHLGLSAAGGGCYKPLMLFLGSIFKPRLTRCDAFTKEKTVRHFAERVKMRYVDLEKVEAITTFSDRTFSAANICLWPIPERIRGLFHSDKKPEYGRLEELLVALSDTKESSDNSEAILNINPGVTINNFI